METFIKCLQVIPAVILTGLSLYHCAWAQISRHKANKELHFKTRWEHIDAEVYHTKNSWLYILASLVYVLTISILKHFGV